MYASHQAASSKGFWITLALIVAFGEMADDIHKGNVKDKKAREVWLESKLKELSAAYTRGELHESIILADETFPLKNSYTTDEAKLLGLLLKDTKQISVRVSDDSGKIICNGDVDSDILGTLLKDGNIEKSLNQLNNRLNAVGEACGFSLKELEVFKQKIASIGSPTSGIEKPGAFSVSNVAPQGQLAVNMPVLSSNTLT